MNTLKQAIASSLKTRRNVSRLIKVALLTKRGTMMRGELHKILNLSRPSWPFTVGEISDALHELIQLNQIEFQKAPYFDSSHALVTLITTA